MKSFLEHVKELQSTMMGLAKNANLSVKPSKIGSVRNDLITQSLRTQGFPVTYENNKIRSAQNPKDPGSAQIPVGQNINPITPTLSDEARTQAAAKRVPLRKTYRTMKLPVARRVAEETSSELAQLSKINKADLKEYPGKKGEKYHHALHKLIGRMTKKK